MYLKSVILSSISLGHIKEGQSPEHLVSALLFQRDSLLRMSEILIKLSQLGTYRAVSAN